VGGGGRGASIRRRRKRLPRDGPPWGRSPFLWERGEGVSLLAGSKNNTLRKRRSAARRSLLLHRRGGEELRNNSHSGSDKKRRKTEKQSSRTGGSLSKPQGTDLSRTITCGYSVFGAAWAEKRNRGEESGTGGEKYVRL